ncbi:ABC transporter ATP-binding protein [Saccharibacillus kuerlensis]|uniref:ABC transporter domain-containing protein n=1 Tax=Saccharibacillus kuerlensis TaxID=459527 RepID=A0ABQ2L013_9BACL|nr:ABC transporter ATP-binding protein [Saccharibacillus kuerlensis]GGN98335.1 hypothetical protein GCM10010969_17320 [Saccharibacillus kuerlensis]
MTSTHTLEVRGLQVRVNDGGKSLPLLKAIDLTIEKGQVLGLVGESGSGKSITCSAILQLLNRRGLEVEGSVRLNGRQLTKLPNREIRMIRGREIGTIMQNPMNAFTPVYTVGSQFVETLRTHSKLSKMQARAQAAASLAEVGLSEPARVMKSYPHQLSGGMLQRVMIAISMCLQPALVIADEPTTALDSVNQLQVLRQLDKLRTEYGTSILLVSHDLGVIARMADTVAVMKAGEIVEHADVHDLFDRPQHDYTRMLLQARLRGRKDA